MKNKDKIILYLDGQMTEHDRSVFEKELAADIELKNEFNRYRQFLENLNSFKNIKTDPDYFINIIPEFRKKLAGKTGKKLLPKLAAAFATAAAVFLIIIFALNRTDNSTVNSASSNNVDSVLENYTFNYSPVQDQFDISGFNNSEYSNLDSLVTSMLSNELNLSTQSLSDLSTSSDNTDLQSMLQGIDNREADQIYNELLHKRIY